MRDAALGAGIVLRSLCVQASWNYRRMQNLGFFFMIFPALAQRHPRGSAALMAAALRHLQLFNTHPYYAGLVAATVARAERDGEGAELVAGLKRSLMCALGGIGDEFFWAHLRPLAALAALPLALGGWAGAPLILLAIFNGPHLGARVWGVARGLAHGKEIVGILQSRVIARSIPPLGTVLVAGAGLVAGSASRSPVWGIVPGRGGASLAAAAAVFLVFALVQWRGLSQERLLAGLTVAALLAGGLGLTGGAP